MTVEQSGLRYLFTVLTGVSGALLALLLKVPVPWLIGSLFFCAIVTRSGFHPPPLPAVLERWMRVMIGVSLGPSVAASVQSTSDDLLFALAAAILATVVSVAAGMRWFRHRTDLPRASAFLASMPGGLSMLMAMGEEIDNRARVVLVHTVRVVIVVVSISLLARVLGVPQESHPIMASLEWRTETSPVMLVLLILVNYLLAEKIRIAGGHVIFPMISTGLLIGFAGVSLEPPAIMQTTALLVFGVNLGIEFARQPARSNVSLSLASVVFTVAVMMFVALLAVLLTRVVDQSFLVLFLALAPGGIAEISLVALALGLDAGLVALVHSCRFIFIALAGSLGFKYFSGKRD